MRLIHSVSFISAVVMLAMIVAPGRPAEAKAVYQGSIEIQARICPAGALELSAECIHKRGPLGVRFSIDTSLPKAMDLTGNVSFDDLIAGDHLVMVKAGPYAERFRQLHAFCSNSITGIYPGPAIVDTGDEPQFRVQLAPRSRVTCEVFFIP